MTCKYLICSSISISLRFSFSIVYYSRDFLNPRHPSVSCRDISPFLLCSKIAMLSANAKRLIIDCFRSFGYIHIPNHYF